MPESRSGLYGHVGLAVALSPRLPALLAEAARHAGAFGERLSLIHAAPATPEIEKRIRDGAAGAGLPADTPIHFMEGAPEDVILGAIERHDIDFLFAGALEREGTLRYYLGSVARNLVREAACPLLLFTDPSTDPRTFERIVLLTDYSENAQITLSRVLRVARREGTKRLHVLRIVSEYGEAIMRSEGSRGGHAQVHRSDRMAEERKLLRDFVDAAGSIEIPLEAHCIEGHTGPMAAAFVREREADLLVMPLANRHSHYFERVFPSEVERLLRDIPCNLWVARERAPGR